MVGVRVFTAMQAAGPLEAGTPETVCWIGVGEDGKAGRSFPGEVSSTKFRSTSSKATQACRLCGLPEMDVDQTRSARHERPTPLRAPNPSSICKQRPSNSGPHPAQDDQYAVRHRRYGQAGDPWKDGPLEAVVREDLHGPVSSGSQARPWGRKPTGQSLWNGHVDPTQNGLRAVV